MSKKREFQFQFRKSYETRFHGIIVAKNEDAALKGLRKFAKTCFPEDFDEFIDANVDYLKLDDGDDFVVWAEKNDPTGAR